MLESLSSGEFSPLINHEITLTTDAGERVPAVVVEVIENPKGKPRMAPASRRVPFSVLLAGPLQPSLIEGACTLVLPGSEAPVSVHVHRVTSADGLNDRAWYEIAFC